MADAQVKLILDSSQVDQSLSGMRKSIKELSKQLGNNLLSDQDKMVILGRMGELKEGIMDYQKNIKQLGDDNYFENAAQAIRPLVGGFEALTSVQLLFGKESKALEEAQRRVIALIGLMQSLQEISDTKKLKAMVLYRLSQLQEIGVRVKNKLMIGEEVIAQNALTASQAKAGIGIKTLTALQKAWNLVIAANPIVLIVSALAALTVGVIALSKAFGESKEPINSWEKALDGTVIKSEELRNLHNENIIAMRELNIEYKVQKGYITELQGEIDKLNGKRSDELDAVEKATDKKVNDRIEEQTGFWSNLWASIKGGGNVALTTANMLTNAAEAAIPVLEEGQKLLDETNKKYDNQVNKLNSDDAKKKIEKAKEEYKKLVDLATDNYNKRRTLLNNFLIDLKSKTQDNIKEEVKREDERLNSLLQLEKEKYDLTVRLAINSFESIRKAQEKAAITGDDKQLKTMVSSYSDAINNFITASEKGVGSLDSVFLNGSEKLQEYLKLIITYQDTATKTPLDLAKLDDLQTKLETIFASLSSADREQVNNLLVLIDMYKKYQSTIVDVKKEDENYRKTSIENAKKQRTEIEKSILSVEKTSQNILNSLKRLSPEEVLKLDNDAITSDYEQLKKDIEKSYKDMYDALKILSDTDVANKEQHDKDIIALEEKKKQEIEKLNKEQNDAITLNNKNFFDNQKKQITDVIINVSSAAGTAILDLAKNSMQQSLDQQMNQLDKSTENQKRKIDDMTSQGLLTQEQAARKSEIIDQQMAKKKAELQNKQAKAEKQFAIYTAILQSIISVAKALASVPPPANILAAIEAGALGAIQIGAAAATPVPVASYKVGTPKPLATDQVAQLHEGEMVVTKDALQLNPSLGYMISSANNKQQVQSSNFINYEELAKAMSRINVQTKVYEGDIKRTSQNVTQMEGYATYKN